MNNLEYDAERGIPGSRRIDIAADIDVARATLEARDLAAEMGFDKTRQFMIATATSELARNIFRYAGRGEVLLDGVASCGRRGLRIVAADSGPGIADIERALRDGYSTAGSLGIGLPGARRLMDEFAIDSAPGKGTTVRAVKWR